MLLYHLLAQTSSSSADNTSTIIGVIALISIALFLGLLVWSLAWVYGDAERRGKSGCLVVLIIVLFGWPISLLLWVVFRP
jgi:hypothetical protein